MKIAVLGTGMVGKTLGTALVDKGHEVTMGSRSADNPEGLEWAGQAGGRLTTFDNACADASLVINATSGSAGTAVISSIPADHLAGKTLIDVSNPLDFSQGFPPSLLVCNDDSLAEQIQRTAPGANVVKALNTINCAIMVNPSALGDDHQIFIAGGDEKAKTQTLELLAEFGWKPQQILDLGELKAARALEMYLPLWANIMSVRGDANFNIRIV